MSTPREPQPAPRPEQSPAVWHGSNPGAGAPVPGGGYPGAGAPVPGGGYPMPGGGYAGHGPHGGYGPYGGPAGPPVPDISDMKLTADHLGKNTLSFMGMVRSELIKFTSLRSTWIVLAVCLGLCSFIGWMLVSSNIEMIEEIDKYGRIPAYLIVVPVAEFLKIFIPILALLAVTAEYKSGQIRSVLTACPKRGIAYGAKFFAILPFAIASYIVIYGVVLMLEYLQLVRHNMTGALDWDSFWYNSAVALGQVLITCALLMTLGYLLRSTALSLTLFVATQFILPPILLEINADWVKWIGAHMPSSALNNLWDRTSYDFTIDVANELGRGEAWLTIVVWLVALITASYWLFRRGDA